MELWLCSLQKSFDAIDKNKNLPGLSWDSHAKAQMVLISSAAVVPLNWLYYRAWENTGVMQFYRCFSPRKSQSALVRYSRWPSHNAYQGSWVNFRPTNELFRRANVLPAFIFIIINPSKRSCLLLFTSNDHKINFS